MSMKKWLTELLKLYLPEVADLTDTPDGRATAQQWADWMKTQWAQRGLEALSQQRVPMTETRNFIKEHLGADHVALESMNFTEAQWRVMNEPIIQKVQQRNEQVQLLDDPQAIVQRAGELLDSPYWPELAAGLVAVTGRRSTEILSTATFTVKTAFSVIFTGSLKRRGEKVNLSFEIPTLIEADRVVTAQQRLRSMLSLEGLDTPQKVNARYGAAVVQAVEQHFTGLVPPRDGEDLYTHLFRSVYAAIAVNWFCPPTVATHEFKAHIQGHFQVLEAESDELKRSYVAGRHYDDYATHDPQRGIKLSHPGVALLEVFLPKQPLPTQQLETTTTMPETATPAKKVKAVSFRVFPSDRDRLEALRQHWQLPNQASTATHVLDLALMALQLSDALGVAPELVTDNIQQHKQLLQALQAEQAVWAAERAEMSQQIIGLKQQVMQLQTQQGTAPTPSPDPLSQSALTMALHGALLNILHSGLQALPPQANNVPTAPLTVSTPAAPIPQPNPSAPKSTPQQKLQRALDAVIAYNELQPQREDKWFINTALLSKLTGCFRPAIVAFLQQHQELVQQHNQHYGLTEGINISKGMHKIKPTDVIKLSS